MREISRQAFTLLELMVIITLMMTLSSLVIRSTYTYLQEQHLRQAANELVGYLSTAKGRALRDANDVYGAACEVQLDASTSTVSPSSVDKNVCNDPPVLPALNLLTASGGDALTISSSAGSSPYYITFTRSGIVASSNLSSSAAITLPRIFYLSNSSATQMQRCVMVDLNSLRIGWRNSSSTPLCTYNAY